jgi:hypothetical protein
MSIKVQLLVSEWCASCHQAEQVWREVAATRAIDFEVVDMAQPEGRELATGLRIRSIPALVVDGELKGVGVQSREEALTLVAAAPEKTPATEQHVGLSLALSSRLFILSSALYLFIVGGVLAFNAGGLLGHSYARVAPLHLFTLGFVTFLIFGLGEHMLPRFTGNPIRSGAWTWTQFTCAHLGALGFVGGLWTATPALAMIGAASAWFAFTLFFVRLWPVLWPREKQSASQT